MGSVQLAQAPIWLNSVISLAGGFNQRLGEVVVVEKTAGHLLDRVN